MGHGSTGLQLNKESQDNKYLDTNAAAAPKAVDTSAFSQNVGQSQANQISPGESQYDKVLAYLNQMNRG